MALEVCNGIDDDCDELVDTDDPNWDSSTGVVVYLDNDGDGRGNVSTRAEMCYVLEGYVTMDGDCQDSDAGLNPFDVDGDGSSSCEGDCEDGNALINENALEINLSFSRF